MATNENFGFLKFKTVSDTTRGQGERFQLQLFIGLIQVYPNHYLMSRRYSGRSWVDKKPHDALGKGFMRVLSSLAFAARGQLYDAEAVAWSVTQSIITAAQLALSSTRRNGRM
jgi:hypothetical protein